MFNVKGIVALSATMFCLIASYEVAANTEQMCQVEVQVSNFKPSSCYSEYSSANCVDVCSTAQPYETPSCFREMQLPCAIKQELTVSAAGYQQSHGVEWFHVTDLLSHPPLIERYNVLQQALYRDLYQDFVSPAVVSGYSPASDSLRKENFRLNLISATRSMASGLAKAALYRRYEYGLVLEDKLKQHLINSKKIINETSILNPAEQQELQSELLQLTSSQTRLWQILKKYDVSTILASRVSILNRRLNVFTQSLEQLPLAQQKTLISKASILNNYIAVNFRLCDAGTCFDEVTVPELSNIDAYDAKLTYLELYLAQLNNEASLLSNAYSEQYLPMDPAFVRMPSFAGLVTEHYQAMREHTTERSLRRLATAINIAYLAKNKDGEKLAERMAQTASATTTGFTSVANYSGKNTLLCNEYERINPQLNAYQHESFTLGHEANELIAQLIEGGLDTTQLLRLEWIITRLNILAAESIKIANLSINEVDRYLSVIWDLGLEPAFKQNNGAIEIEYVQYDGLYWTPNMLPTLSEVMPFIVNISTPESTLLPTGEAAAGAMNTLQLLAKQTPFTACSVNNRELKMIVKQHLPNGQVERKVLQATLEQL